MSIKVKVLNADKYIIPEVPEEEKAHILTSEYVKKINDGISYRIRLIQAQNEIAVRSLSKRKIR